METRGFVNDGREGYVLVVEDDSAVSEAIRVWLEDEGYRVRIAPDGDAALAECEHERPTVIVLDFNVPVMNGGALVEELRWRPALSTIPIVMTSAMPDVDLIARRLQIEFVLHKPFDLEHASMLLRRAIGTHPR
jgi:CheY-like chemotaxis protein